MADVGKFIVILVDKKDRTKQFIVNIMRGARVRHALPNKHDQVTERHWPDEHRNAEPGVMPYQPDGIWRSPYDGHTWDLSKGEKTGIAGPYILLLERTVSLSRNDDIWMVP